MVNFKVIYSSETLLVLNLKTCSPPIPAGEAPSPKKVLAKYSPLRSAPKLRALRAFLTAS